MTNSPNAEAACPVCGRSAKMRLLSELVGDVRQAFKAGRQQERAAVVAYLRAQVASFREAAAKQGRKPGNLIVGYEVAANRIAADDHLPPTNEEEGG